MIVPSCLLRFHRSISQAIIEGMSDAPVNVSFDENIKQELFSDSENPLLMAYDAEVIVTLVNSEPTSYIITKINRSFDESERSEDTINPNSL